MKKIALFILLSSLAFSQITFSNKTLYEHNASYGTYHSVAHVGDENHFIYTYLGTTTIMYLELAYVNPSTYAMSEKEQITFDGTVSSNAHSGIFVIDSTHAIVAYDDAGDDGTIQTLSISTDKATVANIDTYVHNDTYAKLHAIDSIDATHYLIAYIDQFEDGWAKVIEIDGSYIISMGDSVKFYTGTITTTINSMDIDEIGDSGVFAITYYESPNVRLASVSVNGSYQLSADDEISTTGEVSDVLGINDSTLVFMYGKSDNTMQLKSFTINGSNDFVQQDSAQGVTDILATSLGDIDMIEFESLYVVGYKKTNAQTAVTSFNINEANNNVSTFTADKFTPYGVATATASLIQVDATQFLLLASATGTDGWLFCETGTQTTPRDSVGYVITAKDTIEFEGVTGNAHNIVTLNDTTIVTAYVDADSDGWLKIVKCDLDGTNLRLGDSLEFANNNTLLNIVMNVRNDSTLIIAYDSSLYAMAQTIKINSSQVFSSIDTLKLSGGGANNRLQNGLFQVGFNSADDTTYGFLTSDGTWQLQPRKFKIDQDYNIVWSYIGSSSGDNRTDSPNVLVSTNLVVGSLHGFYTYDNDIHKLHSNTDLTFNRTHILNDVNITALNVENAIECINDTSVIHFDHAYTGTAQYARVVIFDDSTGANAVERTELMHGYGGSQPAVVKMANGDLDYMLLAEGGWSLNYLKTVSVDFTDMSLVFKNDSITVSPDYTDGHLIKLNDNIYVYSYEDGDGDAWIQTYSAPFDAGGWTGNIGGVINPASIGGIPVENIFSVGGVE